MSAAVLAAARSRRESALPMTGLRGLYTFQNVTGQSVAARVGSGSAITLGAASGVEATDPTPSASGLVFTDDFATLPGTLGGYTTQTAFTIVLALKGSAVADRKWYSEASTLANAPVFTLANGQPTDVDNQNVAGATPGVTPQDPARLRMFSRDNNNNVTLNLTSQAVVFDNTPRIIVYTENAGAWDLYIDGVLDSSGQYTRAITSVNTFALGAQVRASPAGFAQGTIAAFGRYSVKLTTDEARRLTRAVRRMVGSF